MSSAILLIPDRPTIPSVIKRWFVEPMNGVCGWPESVLRKRRAENKSMGGTGGIGAKAISRKASEIFGDFKGYCRGSA